MTAAPRLRVLRIRRPANLLTAQAFEDLFDRQFPAIVDVACAPLEAWCDAVFGPVDAPNDLGNAATRFRDATAGYDFFCPSYECIPLAPLLLAVRNRARARARLLFIAHAPGSYSFEWALLHPLLADGDVIIAPTESAARAIAYLCPPIAAFVRTIPHPMARLARAPRRAGPPRIASLGRIHAQKLTHRLVEAMAVLQARGMRALRLEIGGALDDGGWPGPHPYTRALQAKIVRLGLEDRVTLPGPVRGDAAKSAFLSGADAVINLSVTVEESFGKTPVEALGVGVPVVGTDWVGLRDTVGRCGRLVAVERSRDVVGVVDVDAHGVADAIEAVLDAPPSAEACIARAEMFSPSAIVPRYRAALEDAAARSARADAWPAWPDADVCAAPASGLLAAAPPLDAFSWRELFDVHLPWCGAVRRSWSSRDGLTPNDGARVRSVVQRGVEPSLKLFFANLAPPPVPRSGTTWQGVGGGALDVLDRVARAAAGRGLVAGRAACAHELVDARRLSDAATALDAIDDDALSPALVAFWRSQLASASGDAPTALAQALTAARGCDLGESDWPLVRQVALAARRGAAPGAALPVLLAWLDRFPDSQESGPVFLDACVNALRADDGAVELAEWCCGRARVLLGDMPAVRKCVALVANARRAAALVA